MASKRYNVMYPKTYEKNGDTKTSFVRVGTAFPLRDTDGFSVELDVPLVLAGPDCKLVLFVREERDEDPQSNNSNRTQQSRGGRR